MTIKKLQQLVRISALKRDIELGRMAQLTAARTGLQAARDDLKSRAQAAMQDGQGSVPDATQAEGFVTFARQQDEKLALDQARLESDIATQKVAAAIAVGRASVISRLARR